MADGLLMVAGDGRVLVYNRPAEELLELPPGRLSVGVALAEVASIEPLRVLLDQVRAGTVTAGAYTLEIGTRRELRTDLAILPPATADAAPPILLVLHDAGEAERLQSMRRDFIANVSHEVRTPLAAIRGCSATLLAGALGDREHARHFVEIIEQHAIRLGQLVEDLGRLSDLEQGRAELHRRPVALTPALELAVNNCRDRALAGGVALDWRVDAETPALDADRDLLDQALLRLIDNALRYTPRGGHVDLRAGVGASPAGGSGAWVCLRVVDSGVGIPPEELPRLSERFYRPEKSRSRDLGGSGLGLAVVKHIVQAHGGAMQIASALQQGTAVTLLWPASAPRQQPALVG